MNNNNQWWKYYGLKDEPNLSTDPLSSKNELELFYGRENDIKKLETILSGTRRKTLLVTGRPGVGKSTLINKLFHEEKGYIHVNLSAESKIENAELSIAEATTNVLSKISNRTSKKFRKRIENEISKTRSKNLGANASTGCLTAIFRSIIQSTFSPIREIEIRDIISSSFSIINKKNRIYLVLDESDFFDKKHASELIHLSQRIKDLLPKGSVLLLINRDISNDLLNSYNDITSLVRSTFKNFHKLESIWTIGEADIQGILNKRFQNAKSSGDFIFPLTEESCKFLDVMSSGNFKLLIQYTEHVLMFGASKNTLIPLSFDFVKNEIFANFKEVTNLDSQEENVLVFLKETPTHLQDPNFLNLFARGTLQRILTRLEERILVKKSIEGIKKKHIFSVTELGEIILKNVLEV